MNKHTFAAPGKSPAEVLHNSYNNRCALRAHTIQQIMAISKSFFGLRSGSTATHTYAVYNGKQVTKERVTKVANPQSNGQMEQRLKLVQVASAARILEPLINHSFQGVSYGTKSVNEFRRLNLTGSLYATQYVPKGMGDTGVAAFRISRGTLPAINAKFATDTLENSAASCSLKAASVNIQGGETTPDSSADLTRKNLQYFMDANGLNVGDQISFVFGYTTGSNYQWDIDPDTGVASHLQSYVTYGVWRLKLEFDGSSDTALLKDANDFEVKSGRLMPKLKGSENMMGVTLWTEEDGEVPVAFVEDAEEGGTDTTGIYAIAVILSRLNDDGKTWQRSNAQFAIKNLADFTSYDAAKDTYIKKTTAADSTKYLNLGNNVTMSPF